MGRIISSYIMPHPPIIIPEIGKGEEAAAEKTIISLKKVAGKIKEDKPTTIILTSPHGPVFQDFIYISGQNRLEGDFSKFNCPSVKLVFDNNIDMVKAISEEAHANGIFAGRLDDETERKYGISKGLDHGALVPLYFVKEQYEGFKLVHISISGMSLEELYKFGICIYNVVKKSNERVVFIASGDMSHRLSDVSPYGYDRHGPEFDRFLVDRIANLKITDILDIDKNLWENAGECGLRSFVIMLGALDAYELKSEIYSYEGPYGIGYFVARLSTGEEVRKGVVLNQFRDRIKKRIENIRAGEDSYTRLARKALEAYVLEGKIIDVPDGLPEEMLKNRAGIFVSIKKHGELRGCIGTTGPTRKNIAEEIIHNAISSGTRDPRFLPVGADELDSLVYSVDVLKEPEPVSSIDQLDVKRYGVIVSKGYRSGLLLPDLEGVDTPQKQVSIALQKAGIRADEKYEMQRFEVVRHK